MYGGALNRQVTVRYGVLYYRYWSTPVGCKHNHNHAVDMTKIVFLPGNITEMLIVH